MGDDQATPWGLARGMAKLIEAAEAPTETREFMDSGMEPTGDQHSLANRSEPGKREPRPEMLRCLL